MHACETPINTIAMYHMIRTTVLFCVQVSFILYALYEEEHSQSIEPPFIGLKILQSAHVWFLTRGYILQFDLSSLKFRVAIVPYFFF